MAHCILRTMSLGLLILLAAQLSAARHSACRSPPNQELAQYLTAGSSLPESFYQFPQLLKTVTIYNATKEGSRAKDSTFYDEGKQCSDSRNSEGSSCPVTWVFNYDPERYPDTVVEARCNPCEGDSPRRFSCRPVYYYTKVLRRTGCNASTGIYNYVQAFAPVSIGCALQSAKEATNQARAFAQNEDNTPAQ